MPNGINDVADAQSQIEEPARRATVCVEAAVRPVITAQRFEQVVGSLPVDRLVTLLQLVALATQEAVDPAWHDSVEVHRAHRRPGNLQLSRCVGRGPHDRLGGDLGLEDRRHRARATRQVVRTQSNCGVLSAGSCTIVIRTAVVVEQLTAQ